MRTEYKRDMHDNYLILHGEKEIDTTSYQVRMIAGNTIPFLLKCRIQGLEGKPLFYYQITSKQVLASLYEQKKMGYEDLVLIFGGFIRVMEAMSEYLLNPAQLLLTPDHMYVDVEKRELFFCCFPGNEKEIQEQFRELTEYILPKLDHEDEKAVMMGYQIYRKAMEGQFRLEMVKEEVFQDRKASKEIKEMPLEKESSMADPFEEEWQRPKEGIKKGEPEKKKADASAANSTEHSLKTHKWIGRLMGCGIAALLLLAVLLAEMYGFLPWLPVETAICGGIVMLAVGLLTGYLIEKRQNRNLKVEEWRERVKKQLEESGDDLFLNVETAAEVTEHVPESNVAVQKNAKESPVWAKELSPGISWENTEEEYYGETVVLSENLVKGPASLVSREPGELATIYLQEELTVIGKLPNVADAVIVLPTISRVHARIRKQGEDYYLADLNSKNGTSVNGRMLRGSEEYLLQDEDEVDFAQARYIFLK